MFKKFWLDTILAFIFMLLLAEFVSRVSAFKIFDIFDPIGDAIGDMESTDLVFSQLREAPEADQDLVLVNIGYLDRRGIAEMINIINAFEPKVIGIDAFFLQPKEDTLGDMMLAAALANVQNLVMPSKLILPNDKGTFDSLEQSYPPYFNHGETAFVNFISGAADQEDIKVCRTFSPKETVKNEQQLAFAVKLAQYIDADKVDVFLARDQEVEIINFRGNIVDYGASSYPSKYFALDVDDVFNINFTPEIIKDKCIMFCFMGNTLADRKANEDKYFTPLNSKYAGKAHADMFGGVVHANVFSMILAEDYLDEMSETAGIIVALIMLYLNIVLFTYIYKTIPKWYDGLTKLIQLFQILIMLTLVIVVLNNSNYKLDLTWAIVFVGISGDALEVYFGVVRNLIFRPKRKKVVIE